MAARNLETAEQEAANLNQQGYRIKYVYNEANDYLDIVTLNLRSVFMASQAAAKYMAAPGGGSIINISSIGGLVPDISQVAYGTGKAAINYLTKLIAVHEASNHFVSISL